jgi:hypothetical protein
LQNDELVMELNRLADELHILFWEIELTPNLELDDSLAHCIVQMSSSGGELRVVLPSFKHNQTHGIEVTGFAY